MTTFVSSMSSGTVSRPTGLRAASRSAAMPSTGTCSTFS